MQAATKGAESSGELVAPASYIQRTMWAAAQRHRNAPLNVMILPWRVRGPIDARALQLALADLVRRHHTLRTRLANVGGQLLQIVAPEAQVALTTHCSPGVDAATRWEAAVGLLRERGRKPLDLTAGEVFEPWLVQLGPEDHILCFFVHHAMCDGWSSHVLANELVALYGARLQGQMPALPAIEEQYADFAASQIAIYEAGGYADQIAYWRSELAALPLKPLELPTEAPRKGNRDWMARSPMLHWTAPTLTALRQLARAQRLSVFSVLLAALAVLLYQRTRAEDQIIGVSILGRWSPAAMRFVGCATNMLPARIQLRSAMGFDALAVQVHATIRRLMAYGRIPLELVLRELQGTLAGGLHFPVWCQFRESVPPVTLASTGLSLTSFVIERGTLLTELEVDMLGAPDGLVCEFAYRPALFDGGMIDGLMQDYGRLLTLAVQSPGLDVEALGAQACSSGSAAGLAGMSASRTSPL